MPINNNNKKKKSNKPRSKEDAHYVDNKRFYKAFVEYHEKRDLAIAEGRPNPKLPDYIGECFMKIAERYSRSPNFVNYPYRDEMVSDAVENCVLYAHDFNPQRGKNPFAYFSQVAWNAYVRRINKENKNKYVTYKSHQNQLVASGIDHGHSSHSSSVDEGGQKSTQDLYENINSFIDDYERKAKEKRIEKKKRLAALKETPQTSDTKRQAFKKIAKADLSLGPSKKVKNK